MYRHIWGMPGMCQYLEKCIESEFLNTTFLKEMNLFHAENVINNIRTFLYDFLPRVCLPSLTVTSQCVFQHIFKAITLSK